MRQGWPRPWLRSDGGHRAEIAEQVLLIGLDEESPDVGERNQVGLARNRYINVLGGPVPVERHAGRPVALDKAHESPGPLVVHPAPTGPVAYRRIHDEAGCRVAVARFVHVDLAHDPSNQSHVSSPRVRNNQDGIAQPGRPTELHGEALVGPGTEEGEIEILGFAVREHSGGRFRARAVVSAEEDEDLIVSGSTGEGMSAREHKAVGASSRRVRRNRHAGAGPETVSVSFKDDLD
jgi:hypothetical protein